MTKNYAEALQKLAKDEGVTHIEMFNSSLQEKVILTLQDS